MILRATAVGEGGADTVTRLRGRQRLILSLGALARVKARHLPLRGLERPGRAGAAPWSACARGADNRRGSGSGCAQVPADHMSGCFDQRQRRRALTWRQGKTPIPTCQRVESVIPLEEQRKEDSTERIRRVLGVKLGTYYSCEGKSDHEQMTDSSWLS